MGKRKYSADGSFYIDLETGEKVLTGQPSVTPSGSLNTTPTGATTTYNPDSGSMEPASGTLGQPLDEEDTTSSNFDLTLPTRTTIADAYKTVQSTGVLPEYRAIDYTAPTATLSTDQLGDDYFQSIEDQAVKNLNDKYFGANDSLQARLTNQMNKRGMIGSGIEAGATTDLYKTFGDDLVDLQSNVLQQKLSAKQELENRNADTQNQFALSNAENSLAAQQKNREYEGFLAELGLRSAADEAKTATDFDTGMFEQQVNLMDKESGYQNNFLEQLNSLLGNEKIDKTTRETIRDILMRSGFGFDDDDLMNAGLMEDTRDPTKTQTYGG